MIFYVPPKMSLRTPWGYAYLRLTTTALEDWMMPKVKGQVSEGLVKTRSCGSEYAYNSFSCQICTRIASET
jgi:hypothetical protein